MTLFGKPSVSQPTVDNDAPIGNTGDADGKSALHVKMKNTVSEVLNQQLYPWDEAFYTYSGTQMTSAVYKYQGITIATLTMTLDASNNVVHVVRT